MLVGEFQHNVDPKGRLIVPAKFREELGERFVITKGLDNCIFVFPQSEWDDLEEKLSGLSLSKGRDIQRFFIGSKTECELDKQGRILVPQNLRTYANLTKDVVFVGVAKRGEIWDKKAWDDRNAKFMENPDEVAMQMEDLGI